ncbi:MAG TPA: bifunctional UDP-sugar hydrolase/5'-nucleotidase [Bacteroidota bacterium]|nr:bifunctional UDP-sugar hydrolase/5'-nucleotidase [Bacteroidota bacterium]
MISTLSRLQRVLCILITGVVLFALPLLAQPKQITILHTNDLHASFLPHEAYWIRTNPKPLVGGFNELAFALDSVKKTKGATLLLDAGDLMTGNPITDRTYKGAEGGALVEMLNRMGYEGWEPGNHDFDISYANLLKLVSIAKFPVFTANLVDEKTGRPITGKEYIIVEKNGLKIGVFGLMSKEYYNLVSAASTKGVKLEPYIAQAQKMIDLLRPKVDLVIALTHIGVDDDSVLAMNVKGLNVIIGGHSHTRLRKPKYINDVVIAQTGSNCENLGVLDLTVENKTVTKWDGTLDQLWYHPDRKTAVTALVDSFQTEIKKEYDQVIATVAAGGKPGDGEQGLGAFLAAAHREAAHTDIGFMNTGGVRKRLLPGPITKQDLFEVLPFRNMLMKFEMSGAQVRSVVAHLIQARPGMIISGVQCDYKRDASGAVEIVNLTVAGKPVDAGATYTAAASDYVMGEAKRYLGIDAPKLTDTGETVFNAILKLVVARKTIELNAERPFNEVK